MVLKRNVEQEETTCRIQKMTTLVFLLFEFSSFVLFLKLILCPLCNSDTLWNTLMVLGRNVEQDKRMRRIQERQLCLSKFFHYLFSLYLTVIMH